MKFSTIIITTMLASLSVAVKLPIQTTTSTSSSTTTSSILSTQKVRLAGVANVSPKISVTPTASLKPASGSTSVATSKTKVAPSSSGFSTIVSPRLGTGSSSSSSVTPLVTEPATPVVVLLPPVLTNCPLNLGGGKYQSPKLIVPVSPRSPNTAFGKVSNPIISPGNTNSTLFAFDVPNTPDYKDACAVIFLFPYGNQAVTPYNFTGTEQEVYSDGGINFASLSGGISSTTTFNNKPSRAGNFGPTQIFPGETYMIDSFPCQDRRNLVIEATSVNGVGLQYVQSDKTEAIGLFVVPCTFETIESTGEDQGGLWARDVEQ